MSERERERERESERERGEFYRGIWPATWPMSVA